MKSRLTSAAAFDSARFPGLPQLCGVLKWSKQVLGRPHGRRSMVSAIALAVVLASLPRLATSATRSIEVEPRVFWFSSTPGFGGDTMTQPSWSVGGNVPPSWPRSALEACTYISNWRGQVLGSTGGAFASISTQDGPNLFGCLAGTQLAPSVVNFDPPSRFGSVYKEGDCRTYIPEWTSYGFVFRRSDLTPYCVATCDSGTVWSQRLFRCVPGNSIRNRVKDRPLDCPAAGNPIYPLTGAKRQSQSLGIKIGTLDLTAIYDNRRNLPIFQGGDGWLGGDEAFFGGNWFNVLSQSLLVQASSASGEKSVLVSRGDGVWETLQGSDISNLRGDSYRGSVAKFDYTGWRLEDRANARISYFGQALSGGAMGLSRIQDASGQSISLAYSDNSTTAGIAPWPGLVIAATDTFGRITQFSYTVNNVTGTAHVSRIVDARGFATMLTYTDQANIRTITWPDGSVLRFEYERPDLPWALTGVVDEMSQRYSTYRYDSVGRAISTEKAGGVSRFSATWATPPSRSVLEVVQSNGTLYREHGWEAPTGVTLTTPRGTSISYGSTLVDGVPRLSVASQPAGSGCAASTSSRSYDLNGNAATLDDFNGSRVCKAFDLSRDIEISRLEGLPAGASCTALALPQIPVGSRKVSTQWHPDWDLKTRVAEPGRITTYVYNGQADPYAGGVLASCAPASALLQDGKPIAVLCRQVEQATADPDGAAGFAAAARAGVAPREQRWTYNASGQVLTHDGPRNDVVDITYYEYYTDTSFSGADPNATGHSRGDLMRVINPAGHTTQYTLYNKAGQLVRSVDPNGVVSDYAYDARGRLTSQSVSGQATVYAWWPTGLIQRIAAPDGNWTYFEHDAAHRLWRVSDNSGNSIVYTLDNEGNRTAESVVDPTGTLRRHVARGIDALGRVDQVTGRE